MHILKKRTTFAGHHVQCDIAIVSHVWCLWCTYKAISQLAFKSNSGLLCMSGVFKWEDILFFVGNLSTERWLMFSHHEPFTETFWQLLLVKALTRQQIGWQKKYILIRMESPLNWLTLAEFAYFLFVNNRHSSLVNSRSTQGEWRHKLSRVSSLTSLWQVCRVTLWLVECLCKPLTT